MSSDVLSVDATYPGDRKKEALRGNRSSTSSETTTSYTGGVGSWGVVMDIPICGGWWQFAEGFLLLCENHPTWETKNFGTSGSTTKHGNNLVQSSPKHLEVTGIGPDHPSNGLVKTTRRDNLWVKWGYPLVIYSPHWSIGNQIFSRTMVDPPWNRSSFNHWWVPLWLANGSTGPGSNRQSGLGGQDQGTRWADVIGEWREWRKFPSLEDSDGLASQQTRWFLSGLPSQSNQMVTVASSMKFHGYPWRSVSSSRRWGVAEK